MAFPEKGVPTWQGGGGAHVNSPDPNTGLAKDALKAVTFNELERVADIGMDGLEGTSIASAATTDITASDAPIIVITGSTGPITSFGNGARAGFTRRLIFASNPQINDSASLKIYPSGRRNIIAAAGDVALVVSRGSNNWEIIDYQRADGFPLTGLIQEVYVQDGTGKTVVNSPIPFDNSEPGSTEGGEIITATITPKYADSELKFHLMTGGQAYLNSRLMTIALFKDSESLARSANSVRTTTATAFTQISLQHSAPAVAAVSQTWKMRLGTHTTGGGTDIWVNQDSTPQQKFNGVCETSIMIEEIRS